MRLGKVSSKKNYRFSIAIFLILAISVVGIVAYFALSRAKITLIPKTEMKMVDFTVIVDKNAPQANFETNTLPGEIIVKEDVVKKKIGSVSAKRIPGFAKGKITVYNEQGKKQALLPKSHLLAENGFYFLTNERVAVGARSSAEVGITAEKEGEEGNIPLGNLIFDRLTPSLQKLVYAKNIEPLTGGFNEVQIVKQEDIDSAFKEAENELEEKIKKETEEGLSEDEEIATIPLYKEILEKKASVEPETNASEFEVELKIKFSAFVVNKKNLADIGEMKLSQNIPENREFIKTRENSFGKEVKNVYLAEGKMELRLHSEGEIAYKVSSKAFDKSKIIGLSREEVKNYFKEIGGIENVKVDFSPLWVKTVPSLKNNVIIQVGR